jgi:hypothetical protein
MKILKHSIGEEGSFDYDENNIVSVYTVPEYKKYLNAEYQYWKGFKTTEWMEYKDRCEFQNLPSGQYV